MLCSRRSIFGILSVVPKTKDGTPITDYEAELYDNGHELKNG